MPLGEGNRISANRFKLFALHVMGCRLRSFEGVGMLRVGVLFSADVALPRGEVSEWKAVNTVMTESVYTIT